MIQNKRAWFSIIEVLVSILVFSFWLVSIYTLIFSTLRLNDYNQNFIIASNLAREQIELFKNIRDSNYQSIHAWNQKNPLWSYSNAGDFFSTGTYYTLENNFSTLSNFPVKVTSLSDFWEGLTELTWKMKEYKLCIWNTGYTYDCTWMIESIFYRYLKIDEAKYMSWATEVIIPNSFVVTSKVIWYKKGYHETELKTLITDWKRL